MTKLKLQGNSKGAQQKAPAGPVLFFCLFPPLYTTKFELKPAFAHAAWVLAAMN